jgi:hypothetical protein
MMELFPFYDGGDIQPETPNQFFNTDGSYWNNYFVSHSELDIATEYLNLSKLDREIITGSTLNNPWEFYGLGDWNELIDEDIVYINNLLKCSGLSFKELKELLTSRIVNPNGLPIEFEDPNKCALDTARIDGDTDLLAKLYKFTRLRRKLNWTVKELDLAIDNLTGDKVLDDEFIIDLWKVKKLADRYQIPVVELLAWWYEMDKDTDARYEIDSLYTSLFLNKAVKNPGSDPMNLGGLIITDNECIQVFKAALNITAEEIRLLVDNGLAGEQINLENITKLFRAASFCRYNDISIKDFIDLHTITNASGIFNDTDATIEFIKHVDYLKNSPFDVEELGYLINNFSRVNSLVKPASGEIKIQLDELRTELLKKKSELLVQNDNSQFLIQQKINNEASMIIEGTGSHIDKIINDILSPDDLDVPPTPTAVPLINNGAYFKDSDLASKKLLGPIGPGYLSDPHERYAFFLGQHTYIPAGELDSYPEDDLKELTVQVLRKVITNNSVEIIAGESVLSIDDQNSIIDDQTNIFNATLFGVDPKTLFTAVNNTNYIQLKHARLNKAIKALNIEEDESRIVKNLRQLLNKTFEPDDVNIIVEFITKKDDLDNDEQIYLVESLLNDYLEDVEDAKTKLVYRDTNGNEIESDDVMTNVTLRTSYLIGELLLFHLKNMIINFFSTRFGIDTGLMEDMLLKYVPNPKEENKSGIRIFLNYTFLGESVTKADYTDQEKFYLKLYKASMVARRYAIERKDAAIILQDDEHWLNFCDLIIGEELPDGAYSKWLNLNKAYQIQNKYFSGDLSLFGYINSRPGDEADDEQIRDYWAILGTETGWLQDDIEYMICANKFEFPLYFNNEEWIYKLMEQFEIINSIGVAAKEIIKWNKTMETTAETAEDIRETIKAHYDNKKWIEIAMPLRNALRQKQRDALVLYLTGNKDEYEDAFDLYDAILMDPEMEPCAMTSRVKQATLSVQLFIQRVLLNLETYNDDLLSLTEQQAEEWQWRKNYRLWEANRKVFLYPENWLDPELRMDKSPMFAAIEEKLTQSEVSDENVQSMYLDYLNSLDEVARLEIAGMFEEKSGNDSVTLHVIGRTPSSPHKYFYRKQAASSWTPWSPIDVEIEGNHLLPVFWHGQLFLYWPVFIEKAVEEDTVPYPEENKGELTLTKPKKYFEIKLAWTRLKNGKWDPKRVSSTSFDMHEPEVRSIYWYASDMDYNRLKHEFSLISAFGWSNDLSIRMGYPFEDSNSLLNYRAICIINIKVPNAEPVFEAWRGGSLKPITTKGYLRLDRVDENNNPVEFLKYFFAEAIILYINYNPDTFEKVFFGIENYEDDVTKVSHI